LVPLKMFMEEGFLCEFHNHLLMVNQFSLVYKYSLISTTGM
jgi:hypothetical protein